MAWDAHGRRDHTIAACAIIPAVRVLVTGGAGFVGGSVALALKQRHPAWEVTALDNLKRRGSELA